MTQNQMGELFKRTKKTISEHVSNIFIEGELEEHSTVRKFRTVQNEGNRIVNRQVLHYNLDVIISVGYRVKSKRGTQFRQWANTVLKEYLIEGYAVNRKRLEFLQQEVTFLHSGIQIMSRAIEDKAQEKGFEWLNEFSTGLSLLDDYDHENLDTKGASKAKALYPTKKEYDELVEEMRNEFDSDVFGVEKDGGFDSSINQIEKGFENEDFYPSLQEKAATLLYLVVKNHAFTDGNKRIAAACFLLFLRKNNMLYTSQNNIIIGNDALASLTLFIAASKPEEMETVKRLTVSILNRNKN